MKINKGKRWLQVCIVFAFGLSCGGLISTLWFVSTVPVIHLTSLIPEQEPYLTANIDLGISKVDPIDLVYTWVNGSDPNWIRTRDEYLLRTYGSNPPPIARDPRRYLDYGSLYFSIKLSYLNAPWVRRIFVVVSDGQRPTWFNRGEFPNVVFVDHSKIFKNPRDLPTYNSCAIESNLHRIPGLSERYVYSNDDLLITSPMYQEHLFPGRGVLYQFDHVMEDIPKHMYCSDNVHHCAHHTAREELRKRGALSEEPLHVISHTLQPFIKSEMFQLEGMMPRVFQELSSTHFREFFQINPASLYYQSNVASAVPKPGIMRWLIMDGPVLDFEKKLQNLQSNPSLVTCIADDLKLGNPAELIQIFKHRMKEFLEDTRKKREVFY